MGGGGQPDLTLIRLPTVSKGETDQRLHDLLPLLLGLCGCSPCQLPVLWRRGSTAASDQCREPAQLLTLTSSGNSAPLTFCSLYKHLQLHCIVSSLCLYACTVTVYLYLLVGLYTS